MEHLFRRSHVYAVRDGSVLYVSDSLPHLIRGYNKLRGRQYITRTGLLYGMKRGKYKGMRVWEGPAHRLSYNKNEQIVLINGLVTPATLRFLKATSSYSATDSRAEEEAECLRPAA